MSCGGNGGRFVCGMRRFDKYKIACEDKPSNKTLHDENTRRFQELMDLRSRQDKGIFEPLCFEPLRLEPLPFQNPQPLQTQFQTQFQNQNQNQIQSQVQTKAEKNPERNPERMPERIIDFNTYLK